ncbi:hypothetical protein [Pseudarthrobacter sp. BIM B-2242]|uniref:hypothetical protein n=1 Tax=Pseudarthrobacter sp. BIM B-2242 TaxID=2772401 RepID=UPI00168A954D|nr:hypothetical protein [Pseudarthrobacter sp. BIM B-2242]QOD02612.1 hypothetical protein IDT60_14810 [Pseudarthrobacter sp. BIM B-2242]
MSELHHYAPKLLRPGSQRTLFVAAALGLAVGSSLFLFTTQTDRFFAWTIQSALTAAFLGGSYLSAAVLFLMGGRERLWENARGALPGVIVFSALTFAVTLIHADKFHFSAGEIFTSAGTWVWLVIYALVPIVLTLVLILQVRSPGSDSLRQWPLASWARAVLCSFAAAMVFLGVVLLVAPGTGGLLWPWALTPLTGRAVGAWLVGLGIAAGQAALENELRRVRPLAGAAVTFGVLQFIALLRFPSEFDWGGLRGWFYLTFLVLFLLVGAYCWLAGRTTVASGPSRHTRPVSEGSSDTR